MDRSDASAGLTSLKNGAKETRTPDPLHAMQVLYQLSYGPMPRVILSEELVNA